jgi:hypothetical protein
MKAHVVLTFVGVLFGVWGALTFRPAPFSDFLYYWQAAGDFHQYHKGAGLLLLYAPFRAFDVPPLYAAVVINTFSFLALSWALMLPRAFRMKGPAAQLLGTLLVLPVATWFVGMFGIVNSDVPHVALVALGVRLIGGFANRPASWLLGGTAVAVLALGLSMRLQSVVVIGVAVLVYCGISYGLRQRPPWHLVIVVSAALFAALALEYGFRAPSARTDGHLSARAALYTGFIATEPGDWCGGWTMDAVARARAELSLPLVEVLKRRAADRSLSQMLALIRCKLLRYLGFTDFSVYWLENSLDPSVARRPGIHERLSRLRSLEALAGSFVKWATVLALAALGLRVCAERISRREAVLAASAPWLLALLFLASHSVLEIQPRYLIEPVIFCLVTSLYLLARPEPTSAPDLWASAPALRSPRKARRTEP